MCLYWGIQPIPSSPTRSHYDEIEGAMRIVQLREDLPNGSLAVITGGVAVHTPGGTSVLEIRELSFRD
jgi:pyruvate kinase